MLTKSIKYLYSNIRLEFQSIDTITNSYAKVNIIHMQFLNNILSVSVSTSQQLTEFSLVPEIMFAAVDA